MNTVNLTDDSVIRASGLGRIDQYVLIRKLGGSSFGVVYLVEDGQSGSKFALKTFHEFIRTNADELGNISKIVSSLSKIRHPGIAGYEALHKVNEVSYSDAGIEFDLQVKPGDTVLIMDFAPGCNLEKWCKTFSAGMVPFEKIIDVSSQLALALDRAHSEGMVHHDLKPSNIVVDVSGDGHEHVSILDFGISAEIHSFLSCVALDSFGSSDFAPYMSPEKWDEKPLNERADQYALASVVYEMLAGKTPFAGAFRTGDAGVISIAVRNEDPEKITSLTDRQNAALQRALSKNPARRFPNCRAFISELACREIADPEYNSAVDADVRAASVKVADSGTDLSAFLHSTSALKKRHFVINDALSFDLAWLPPGNVELKGALKKSIEFTDGFWIACSPVTQGQWTALMGECPAANQNETVERRGFCGFFKKAKYSILADYPVESVSWFDAMEFVRKLNSLQAELHFDLPAEEQWEYAALGNSGETDAEYGGNTVGDAAWNNTNSNGHTHAVRTKKPNRLDIYDMSGNVWEWCRNKFSDYSRRSRMAPIVTNPDKNAGMAVRGGGFASCPDDCKIYSRRAVKAADKEPDVGFRVVASKI